MLYAFGKGRKAWKARNGAEGRTTDSTSASIAMHAEGSMPGGILS